MQTAAAAIGCRRQGQGQANKNNLQCNCCKRAHQKGLLTKKTTATHFATRTREIIPDKNPWSLLQGQRKWDRVLRNNFGKAARAG